MTVEGLEVGLMDEFVDNAYRLVSPAAFSNALEMDPLFVIGVVGVRQTHRGRPGCSDGSTRDP